MELFVALVNTTLRLIIFNFIFNTPNISNEIVVHTYCTPPTHVDHPNHIVTFAANP